MRDYPHLEAPELKPFDPFEACLQKFPITTYQPTYFVAEDLMDVQVKMDEFCDKLQQPFFPQYNPLTQNVVASKSVSRMSRMSTVELQAQKQKEYFEELHAHAGHSRKKQYQKLVQAREQVAAK